MFNIQDSKKENLPISYDIDLDKKYYFFMNVELETVRKFLHDLAIRSIIYVIIYTHQDVSYILSVINRLQVNSDITH
jgi:hypothetical protein